MEAALPSRGNAILNVTVSMDLTKWTVILYHHHAMKVNTSVLILAVFAWSFAVMEMMTVGTGVMRLTVRKWMETVAGESSSVTMANAFLSGGNVMEKKTVALVRMKRIAQRNVHAHADWMNFHVPLATAY
jgi:hypothetical protein